MAHVEHDDAREEMREQAARSELPTAELQLCDKYAEWAMDAVRDWDGVSNGDLIDCICERFGCEVANLVFANGRAETDNERHLFNLLSWRSKEADQLREEIAVLREQLNVAVDRSQSWKNLAGKFKELADARGEALDMRKAVPNGVADFVAPGVRPLREEGDVRGPAEQCRGEEGPAVWVVDSAGPVGTHPAPLPGVREARTGVGDTSGNSGFDHFATERFTRSGEKVKLMPDPLGGQFSTGMTPEQAEYLVRHLGRLITGARAARGVRWPEMYPEDAVHPSPGPG